MSDFSIKGKKILITGATSGIGLEMAKKFSLIDAKLHLLGRNQNKIINLQKQLSLQNVKTNHKIIQGDLNLDLDYIESKIDKLDGIVFNAGIVDYKPLKFLNKEDLLHIFNTNYFSSIFLLKQLIKKRKINNQGSIVFISSISAKLGVAGTTAYAASKASVDSSVRVLANELSKNMIRVNSVAPGIIRTPLLDNNIFNEEKYKLEEKKYPLGLGLPIDVVNSVQFLLSDASRWITGSTLELNGGYKLN